MAKKFFSLPPVAFIRELVEAYLRVSIPRSAAALSYFLILTLFPLLLCVNYFIGLFHLDLEALLTALAPMLPADVPGLLKDYVLYASFRQSPALLAASLFTLVVSASAGLRTLLQTMDQLYERTPNHPIGRFLLSILLSVLLLVVIYLSVVVIFTGNWFFALLETHLPQALTQLLPLRALAGLWRWLRYLLLFCFMLLLVLAIYCIGTPAPARFSGTVLFSSLLTASSMVAFSTLFSWFVSFSSRYALVYGSLASLILLLVWLYFCGTILLIGAAITQVLLKRTMPQLF